MGIGRAMGMGTCAIAVVLAAGCGGGAADEASSDGKDGGDLGLSCVDPPEGYAEVGQWYCTKSRSGETLELRVATISPAVTPSGLKYRTDLPDDVEPVLVSVQWKSTGDETTERVLRQAGVQLRVADGGMSDERLFDSGCALASGEDLGPGNARSGVPKGVTEDGRCELVAPGEIIRLYHADNTLKYRFDSVADSGPRVYQTDDDTGLHF
jgi:hypothetical protein